MLLQVIMQAFSIEIFRPATPHASCRGKLSLKRDVELLAGDMEDGWRPYIQRHLKALPKTLGSSVAEA